MANLSLERLVFDPADADNSPNLGAYLRAGSDGDQLTSTLISGKEALDVNLVGSSDGGIFDEDSAHASGDKGQFVFAVRNDVQGSLVDTNGDFAPFQVDSEGRLRCITDIDLVGDLVGDDEVDSEDPLKVGSHSYNQASALSSVSAGDKSNLASDLYRRIFINDAPNVSGASSNVTIDDTAGGTVLVGGALAGRTRMQIQNRGNKSVYVGFGTLTIANGMEISKGGTLSLEVGQAVNIKGICATGETADIRVMELA